MTSVSFAPPPPDLKDRQFDIPSSQRMEAFQDLSEEPSLVQQYLHMCKDWISRNKMVMFTMIAVFIISMYMFSTMGPTFVLNDEDEISMIYCVLFSLLISVIYFVVAFIYVKWFKVNEDEDNMKKARFDDEDSIGIDENDGTKKPNMHTSNEPFKLPKEKFLPNMEHPPEAYASRGQFGGMGNGFHGYNAYNGSYGQSRMRGPSSSYGPYNPSMNNLSQNPYGQPENYGPSINPYIPTRSNSMFPMN